MNRFYNVNQAVSRNRPLNFIVGARGIGKTYGFKLFTIKRFLKEGEEFIYLRQSQKEIQMITDYWGSLPSLFTDHEFKQNGTTLYIDGKKCGELWALSQFVQMKSNEYARTRYIIFDEFLDNSNWNNRAEKPFALASIIDSVFRNREGCKVFCLANAESLMNEYFEFFGIYPKNKKGVTLTKDISLEVVDSSKYKVTEERANNWLSRVTEGTEYAQLAQSNEFHDDNNKQVKKLPAGAELLTRIFYHRDYFEIWTKGEACWITATKHKNLENEQILTIHDSAPGRELFKADFNTWRRVTQSAEKSKLYFDNKRTREICYVWLKKFLKIG